MKNCIICENVIKLRYRIHGHIEREDDKSDIY